MRTLCPKCGGRGSWIELHDGTPVLRHACGFWGHGMSAIESAARAQRTAVASELERKKQEMEAAMEAIRLEALEGVCSWGLCDNPSRENSKYCSRACSNKNARARHRERVNI